MSGVQPPSGAAVREQEELEMGHLPRWGGPDVDSAAMLSAFISWASEAPEAELQATFPHLWMVDHRGPGEPLAPPGIRGLVVPSRSYLGKNCQRCANPWGGYQFRWIDPRWLERYEAMRRAGSWTSRNL